MQATIWMRIGAISGGLAVVLGAFGAHGLHETLAERQTLDVWDKAVFYHLIHSAMLCVLAGRMPQCRGPAWAFLTGILLFSGSLYGLALKEMAWLGPITPLGGLSFLIGWGWLALAAPSPLRDPPLNDPSNVEP